eukprot:g9016.t1
MNPRKDTLDSAAEPQSQDQAIITEDAKQPAVKVLENEQAACIDQRTSQETDDNAEVAAAADRASKLGSEERIKLERRRRRCPTVTVEKYLNNDRDEGERTENGEAGIIRPSIARTIMQEDVTEFLRLVQEGACVWDSDDHGWSPLHWASSRGSTIMTYAILQEMRSSQEAGDSGSDSGNAISDYLNATEKLSGWTALHLAIIAGKLDVVYLLMEAGCNPQVKDKVGDKPVNCIGRIRNSGGVARRLRNALLDLSDSEDGSCDESTEPRVGENKKNTTVRVARPLRKRA